MMNTGKFDRDSLIGYIAGIITGITYGLNPLFAMPLMNAGAPVENILFFRYGLSVLILGCWLLAKHESFRVSGKQLVRLLILGACFTMSSLFLFEAYRLIPSGMATTIVFLYPVLVALIMVFMRVYPTWQVWFSIILTFIGVFVLSRNDGTHVIQTKGIVIAAASALAYAMFIVIVNRSKAIRKVSNTLLTFYALIVGTIVFMVKALAGGHSLLLGISGFSAWGNLLGLAVLPTIVSTATLALATRKIGAAKASVLGVFEPITAILVGALAFGEPVTMNVLIGIGLTMAAVTFMIVSSNK
ncbi:MAG: EamA family transporter [Bacteroidales bacterium]|nr:EamA family transporter [Bacteroidales bacterium]